MERKSENPLLIEEAQSEKKVHQKRDEGADIFSDYLSDQSKSMSVLYRTQIS